MTNFSETSTQGWEAVVEDGQTGTRERPDTSPPVSGRKSRRKPEDISKARQLRDDILKLVEQAEAEVKPAGGRVLLRYSGTELKARLLIEGPQQAVLEKWSTQICDAIKRQVGA